MKKKIKVSNAIKDLIKEVLNSTELCESTKEYWLDELEYILRLVSSEVECSYCDSLFKY